MFAGLLHVLAQAGTPDQGTCWAEVYNCYIDMRTPGKAFEEFYCRIAEEGVNSICRRWSTSTPRKAGPGRLIMQVEDTLVNYIRKVPVDIWVFSVDWKPGTTQTTCAGASTSPAPTKCFLPGAAPEAAPVSTFTDGIFLAGCCQGTISRTRWRRPAPQQPNACRLSTGSS